MLWHRRFAIRAQRELRRLVPRDVNAKFQNGMFEVTIPVPQQREQRRSIPIEGDTKSQADSQKQAV
jgi:HSP20 family molecular chaperone IbpA